MILNSQLFTVKFLIGNFFPVKGIFEITNPLLLEAGLFFLSLNKNSLVKRYGILLFSQIRTVSVSEPGFSKVLDFGSDLRTLDYFSGFGLGFRILDLVFLLVQVSGVRRFDHTKMPL
jgi:hypothetical protein